MNRAPPRVAGDAAEAAAAHFLQARGLRILARNFRCRSGEIDLIAEHEGMLVFVEVRRRRHGGYGGSLASVDRRKQRRLTRAAQTYLQETAQSERPCRFDVVGYDGEEAPPNWIRNAFEAQG